MLNPVNLSTITTFQLGGPCKHLIECATPQELQTVIKNLHTSNTPFVLLGGGSNVVASDDGIPCVVIRYVSAQPNITREGNTITVSASTNLDQLTLYCVEEGLEGLVFASGIPGTVGGAVVGNAGAWGKQVGDVLTHADILDRTGSLKQVDNVYFGFSYRHSKLKENDDIVAAVTFALTKGDPKSLAKKRAEILRQRHEKHPDLKTHPCAGSFFRNIEPTSQAEKRQASGWFLEQVGGKAFKHGGAYIFDKHANIIIKGPHATAYDIYALHLIMKSAVKEKFKLDLQREVRFLGKISQAPESNANGYW